MPGQLGKRTTIGRLRHRLKVQTLTESRDEFGGRGAEEWVDEPGTVRGEVEPTGGRELFQNGGVQAQATHRVKMRYRALSPKQRLVWLDTGIVLNLVACPPSVGTANLVEAWCLAEA